MKHKELDVLSRIRPRERVTHSLMSLLFKHLRIHQVFGANTDVGKTILTSALVRASAIKANNVFYLKPISTGPIDAADDKSGLSMIYYWPIANPLACLDTSTVMVVLQLTGYRRNACSSMINP
jgi:hypothetical protein